MNSCDSHSILRILSSAHEICNEVYKGLSGAVVPWIPEPSTVNNKLKCREGSGSTGSFFD